MLCIYHQTPTILKTQPILETHPTKEGNESMTAIHTCDGQGPFERNRIQAIATDKITTALL